MPHLPRTASDARSRCGDQRLGSEFDKLLRLALMGDWDVTLDAMNAKPLLPTET